MKAERTLNSKPTVRWREGRIVDSTQLFEALSVLPVRGQVRWLKAQAEANPGFLHALVRCRGYLNWAKANADVLNGIYDEEQNHA